MDAFNHVTGSNDLVDIPRDVITKEEKLLFAKLIEDFQHRAHPDGTPRYDDILHEWLHEHYFPLVLKFQSQNETFGGPIFNKDVASLKRYFDREYKSREGKKRAMQSMDGGEQGYRDMQHRAHTVEHFSGVASRFSPQQPKTKQPQQSLLPSTVDPRHAGSFDVQQQRHGEQLRAQEGGGKGSNANRVRAQKGKHHHCFNCGSRKGKKFKHPQPKGGVKVPCPYEKDEFKGNTEGLLEK